MTDIAELMHATVRLEQPLDNGRRTIGTGFIVTIRSRAEGRRAVLVSAHHVFASMPNDKAEVGLRWRDAKGLWRYGPVRVRIRGADGHPLWTRHPTQDVAAIALPAQIAGGSIDASELPGLRALEVLKVRPGDEMMTLGYPRGYSANAAGFPILRAGRVASYPLSPADRYPTYLLDLSVFAGNSGGPVYAVRNRQRPDGQLMQSVVVTGLLTQQLKANGDRLAIGNVTQADFISETIELMAGEAPKELEAGEGAPRSAYADPASTPPQRGPLERLKIAWKDFWLDGVVLLKRAWIVARDWVLDRTTRDPERV